MAARQANGPALRHAGRPSVAADRQRQVIDAFIELIGERGLESVTLDDVAEASGIQRSVIRHYVGNRRQLIRAAVIALTERYSEAIRAQVGDAPSSAKIVELLFGRNWITGSVDDRAFDELYREAARDETTRQHLRNAYRLLIDELVTAIRAERPEASKAAVEAAAYQIVCLAEHNAAMQQLGFDRRLSREARVMATRITDAV